MTDKDIQKQFFEGDDNGFGYIITNSDKRSFYDSYIDRIINNCYEDKV